MIRIKPLSDYLLVEPEETKLRTKGGVYLPDTVKERERPRRGKVLAMGEGVTIDVRIGSRVIYKIWGGNEVQDPEDRDKRYLLVLQEDILAKIVRERR